jgi:hypothetical protein
MVVSALPVKLAIATSWDFYNISNEWWIIMKVDKSFWKYQLGFETLHVLHDER